MQQSSQKCILTINGPISMPELSSTLVLSHECLQPTVCNDPAPPVALEHIKHHLVNPLNLPNTSLTATLFDHEIQLLLSSPHNKGKQLFMVNASAGSNSKTPQLFSGYQNIKGYAYGLPQALRSDAVLSKQSEALTSAEHIKKQIEYQFGLSEERSGFLGQVNLPEEIQLMGQPNYRKAFETVYTVYSNYSELNGCPIFVNLLKHGEEAFSYTESQQFASRIDFFASHLAKNQKAFNYTVLVNPKFIISQSVNLADPVAPIAYTNESAALILKLYERGFNFCFDLLRYGRDKNSLTWVGLFLKMFPSQTILSSGIKYKTDLTPYGGEGLLLHDSLNYLKQITGEQLLTSALNENILKLLCWFVKRVVVQEVRMWACVKCGKESPESEEAFRKFGKDFCSIGCLRSYKF